VFIIQHIQVFCLGILIAAAVAIWAINEVEKTANWQHNGEYEDEGASDDKAAAIASIATSSIAIAFHVFMIILHIYLFSAKQKFFRLYMHS